MHDAKAVDLVEDMLDRAEVGRQIAPADQVFGCVMIVEIEDPRAKSSVNIQSNIFVP